MMNWLDGKWGWELDGGMPRKPRVEYAGALYHVMSRGNRQQSIFLADDDCTMFLSTLEEACGRTGWQVHAYVLMGNHFHLLLETPEPNLVAGMSWLQGTYAMRFNVKNRLRGHLFQGRYKALPVEPGMGYFQAVATYIHLNPVRVQGWDFQKQSLLNFEWSSYPSYLAVSKRPEWLVVERVLGELGLSDTTAGRRKYKEYIQRRVQTARRSDQPWESDEAWDAIRRGWCLGGKDFQREIAGRLDGVGEQTKHRSLRRRPVIAHDEIRAEHLVAAGLKALKLSDTDLEEMLKNSPEKYALAWLVRKYTCVTNGWIWERLHMGKATNMSYMLNKMEDSKPGRWGHAAFGKVKSHYHPIRISF